MITRLLVGDYALEVSADGWLPEYPAYRRYAALVDDAHLDPDEPVCSLAVAGAAEPSRPFLLVGASYARSAGFVPGVVVVPEAQRLFVAIGKRVAVYSLAPPARIWEGAVQHGALGWARYGDYVILAAELEMAAFDAAGRPLWSMYVEQPWNYEVHGDLVRVDVKGRVTSFSLRLGPDPDTPTLERKIR